MSYLKNNNNKIVVDAILTQYGKQKLAATGKLGVYKFAIADDEIDYALYNSLNSMGSDFYNFAIINLPILQALPGKGMSMQYPLYSKDSNTGVVESTVINIDQTLLASAAAGGYHGAYYDRS